MLVRRLGGIYLLFRHCAWGPPRRPGRLPRSSWGFLGGLPGAQGGFQGALGALLGALLGLSGAILTSQPVTPSFVGACSRLQEAFLSVLGALLGLFGVILTFKQEHPSSKQIKNRYQSSVTSYHWSLDARHSNNCLLYTSPSPRDMRRSRMPSSA